MPDYNTATRLLQVIEGAILKYTKSGARIDVTYGQVFGVSGAEASVYLAGSRELAASDGGVPEPSEGFRIPTHLSVAASDYVRVSIDERGHRWIDEVLPNSTLAKLVLSYSNGTIGIGDGTNPTDVNLYRESVGIFATDAVFRSYRAAGSGVFSARQPGDVNDRVRVSADSYIGFGDGATVPDTNIYREGPSKLKTDDEFNVGTNTPTNIRGIVALPFSFTTALVGTGTQYALWVDTWGGTVNQRALTNGSVVGISFGLSAARTAGTITVQVENGSTGPSIIASPAAVLDGTTTNNVVDSESVGVGTFVGNHLLRVKMTTSGFTPTAVTGAGFVYVAYNSE